MRDQACKALRRIKRNRNLEAQFWPMDVTNNLWLYADVKSFAIVQTARPNIKPIVEIPMGQLLAALRRRGLIR